VLVAAAGVAGLWRGVDGAILDLGMRIAADRDPGDAVVLVDIDQASLEHFGNWNRLSVAVGRAMSTVQAGGASVIGLALPDDWGLAPSGTDDALIQGMRGPAPVILGLPWREWDPVPEPVGLQRQWLPRYIDDSAIFGRLEQDLSAQLNRILVRARPPREGRVVPSHPSLAEHAAGVGFLPERQPGTAREAMALVHGDGHFFPSLALHLAARKSGALPANLRLNMDGQIAGPGFNLRTDPGFRYLPYAYSMATERSGRAFPRYTLEEVAAGRVSGGSFDGKVVLIGATAPEWVGMQRGPRGEKVAPVELSARETAAILNGDLYRSPDWLAAAPWAALFLVGLYLAYLLPRMGVATGITLTLLLAVLLFNSQFIMSAVRMMRLDLAMPLIALLAGHAGLGLKQFVDRRRVVRRAESEQHMAPRRYQHPEVAA
jgi:CHASE2 domain-containing sensor protein